MEVEKSSLWDWVKAVCTLILVSVISYKVYLIPIALTVDFPTLLSLLLALFSVALSALFYFKATETSNTFYDNTYNFTKDIAQLLAKMESGFGEKLRNLDEGYSSVRDYIQNNSVYSNEIDITKKKIELENQEFEKVLEERNKIVNRLVEESQLQEEDKKAVVAQLIEKEQELKAFQEEISKMNKKLFIERMTNREEGQVTTGFENFTKKRIISQLGSKYINELSDSELRKQVENILDNLPPIYIKDLEKYGFFDAGLTKDGIYFIRMLSERFMQ